MENVGLLSGPILATHSNGSPGRCSLRNMIAFLPGGNAVGPGLAALASALTETGPASAMAAAAAAADAAEDEFVDVGGGGEGWTKERETLDRTGREREGEASLMGSTTQWSTLRATT